VSFTFLHAADLHLGAATARISRGAPDWVREPLIDSTFGAFDALIEDAISHGDAFVVFAGDLFDTQHNDLRGRLKFRDGVRRLDAAGIPSFFVTGNHDAQSTSSPIALPESCICFSDQAASAIPVLRGGEVLATVIGREYPAKAADFPVVEGGGIKVAIFHGNWKGTDLNYPSICPEDVQGKGYDYWALGHQHSALICQKSPYVVYPGALQGADVTEPGSKGAMRVSVSGGRIDRVEQVSFDKVRWFVEKVDLEGADEISLVERRIVQVLDDCIQSCEGRLAIGRIELMGRTHLHRELTGSSRSNTTSLDALLQTIQNRFVRKLWIDRMTPRTLPPLDLDALRLQADVSCVGLTLVTGEQPPEELVSKLLITLGPLYGQAPFLPRPSADEITLRLRQLAARTAGMLHHEVSE
jgi:DNA repair exonuclease SbcCD nuclease subunit